MRLKQEIAVLRVMGCESTHYGSMEKYLEALALGCSSEDIKLYIMYENEPESKIFVENAIANGATFIKLKMRNKLDFRYMYELFQIIKKYKIKVVHSYFSPTCHYTGFVGKLARIVAVKTAGNMPLQSHLSHREKLTAYLKFKVGLKQLFPALFLDSLICISEAVRNEFISFGVRKKKTIVINLGIETKVFSPENVDHGYVYEEFNLNEYDVIIGTVGRLERQKNIPFMLDVIKQVSETNNNIKFLIVGEGSMKNELISKCKEYKISDKVIFTGRRNDVQSLLKAMDIFVFPSLFEGMGNAILEAMAMQKACIVSDIPVFKEIINDGNNGLICRLNDKGSFACAIQKLIVDRSMRDYLGLNAWKTIQQDYSIEKRVKKTITLYNELLKV